MGQKVPWKNYSTEFKKKKKKLLVSKRQVGKKEQTKEITMRHISRIGKKKRGKGKTKSGKKKQKRISKAHSNSKRGGSCQIEQHVMAVDPELVLSNRFLGSGAFVWLFGNTILYIVAGNVDVVMATRGLKMYLLVAILDDVTNRQTLFYVHYIYIFGGHANTSCKVVYFI